MTFDLGAADTIRALGFEKISSECLQNCSDLSKRPSGNCQKNVGSMKEPDLEAIAALEPDLIIASPRTQKIRRQIQRNRPNRSLPSKQGRLLDFYQG